MNNLKKMCLRLEEANGILKENSDSLFHMKDSVTEDETGSNAIMTCIRSLNAINEQFAEIKKELDFMKDIPEVIQKAGNQFLEAKESVTNPELKKKLDEAYELYSVVESRLFFDKDEL